MKTNEKIRSVILFLAVLILVVSLGSSTAIATKTSVNANFVASSSHGLAPLTVNFKDTSTVKGFTRLDHYWDFGDGDTADQIANPTHTYNNPGDYKVTLDVMVIFQNGDRAKASTSKTIRVY
jgi:PKD repeat protein